AGASLLQIQAELPTLAGCAWLAAAVVVLAPLCGSAHAPRALRCLAACAAAAVLGFVWAGWRAGQRLADALPFAWEGRDVQVQAVIARLPQPFDRRLRLELEIERVLTPGAIVPARVLVTWFGARSPREPAAALPAVRAGERWRMTVRLRRPHGTANPHGFDHEAWLMERGVRAPGYVRLQDPPRRLRDFVLTPAYAIERSREAIRDRIQRVLADEPYAGVIAALAMGDQHAI